MKIHINNPQPHRISSRKRLLYLDFREGTSAEKYVNCICDIRFYELYPNLDLPNSLVCFETPVKL